MAAITLFEHHSYKGQNLTLVGDNSYLGSNGFNDKVSSLVVAKGTWTVYEHHSFRGRSATVSSTGGPNGDGRYPYWQDFGFPNDVMSSVKLDSEE